jgi:hypothetical protein
VWYLRMIPGVVVCVVMTCQTFGKADEPTIHSAIISSGDLPAEFDSTRTFHYAFPGVNPESLLTVLWKADVRVSRAWLPLDNTCMGPIGPLFTVEVESGDSAVLDFGFSSGDGRLRCATRLRGFTISE